HVFLAVAALPVVAHGAAGIADEGAVVDEDRRPDGLQLRHDQRVGQVAGDASRGAGEILKPEFVSRHSSRQYSIPGPTSVADTPTPSMSCRNHGREVVP